MMVVSLHDRISGHANRVRVLDRFLTYAKSKPGVWFARKDEIAAWAPPASGPDASTRPGPVRRERASRLRRLIPSLMRLRRHIARRAPTKDQTHVLSLQ